MANDLGFLKVWAKANQSIRPTSGNLSDFLNEYKSEPSKKDGSDNAYIDNKTYEVEKSDMPEITAEEKSVLDKYGIDATSFTTKDFENWVLEHGYEFNDMKNGNGDPTWVPKYQGFKKVPTKEEQADFEILSNLAGREYLKEDAKNPVKGAILSVGTVAGAVPIQMLSAYANVADTLGLAGVDVAHNLAENAVRNKDLIRETVTEEHASKWFGGASSKLGNYGALTYNGLMSIGDTVVTSLTMKGIGLRFGLKGDALTKFTSKATSGLLASNSMQSTILQKKKEGLSDEKAVAIGFTTGLAEYITEKYSLEAIFKAPTSMIKKGLISFAAEGSEEGFSNILSNTADYFIAGDDSTIRKNITRYMQNGMSRKDATWQATQDSLWETASSVLVGGLSGVAMSSAYHGFAVSEIKNTGKDMRVVADDVIRIGLELSEDSTAHKYAKKLQKKGIDKISDYQLGSQHIYNVEQIEYEQEQKQKQEQKRIKQELKDGKISYPSADSVSSANIGDTFIEQGSNKIIRVVDRNDTLAKVEITTPSGVKETKLLRVAAVDNMVVDDKYTKVETSVDTPTTTEAPTVAENTTVESNVVSEDEAVTTVRNALASENLTSKQIDSIISNPTLRDAFVRLTGVEIKGTKSEQRAIVRNWHNESKLNTTEESSTTETVAPTTEETSANVPQSADNEIADFENMLVAKGVDNTSRQKIMSVARNIQPALANKGKTLKDFYNGVSFGIADSLGVTETSTNEQRKKAYWNAVAKAFATPSNTTTDEHIDTFLSRADMKTKVVVDAIEATLEPGAKETIFKAMEKQGIKGDIGVFAEKLREEFEKSGSIERFAEYFTDNGQEVIFAIERAMDTNDAQNVKKGTTSKTKKKPKESAKKKTVETKTVEPVTETTDTKDGSDDYKAEDEALIRELEEKIKSVEERIKDIPEDDMRKVNGRAAIRGYRDEIELIRKAEQIVEKKANAKNATTTEIDGVEIQDNTIKWDSLNARQKQAITFVKGIAKASGMKLVLVKNLPGGSGAFSVGENIIYLDVFAGVNPLTNKDIIITTMSHELTHWMEQKSPELY